LHGGKARDVRCFPRPGRLRSILRKRSGGKGRSRGCDHQRWSNAFFLAYGLISLSQCRQAIRQSPSGAPTNWRAGCGKSACPVRERGRFYPAPISSTVERLTKHGPSSCVVCLSFSSSVSICLIWGFRKLASFVAVFPIEDKLEPLSLAVEGCGINFEDLGNFFQRLVIGDQAADVFSFNLLEGKFAAQADFRSRQDGL
jgi:hypothetical protein